MPIELYVMKHSSKLIAISERHEKVFSKYQTPNENKIFVVRNWQDDEFLSQKIPVNQNPDKKFTFMFAGSISPSAGVDLLIRAFGDLGTEATVV